MKVGGPKPPIGQTPLDAVDKANGKREEGVTANFRQVLAGEATTSASSAAQDPALQTLVEKLQSGAIGAAEASQEIVELILQRRGASLGDEARGQLRRVLQQALEEDPHLAAKLARMAPTKLGDDEG